MAQAPDASGVFKVIDNSSQLLARLAKLQGSDVLVGIPETKAPRRQGVISNASLAYIHEYGSPARNIPARPFIHPGIRRVRPQIVALFRQAGIDVLQGKTNLATTLNRIGMIGRNSVVNEITNPSPPFVPLRPGTVRGRLRRTQAGRRQLRSLQRAAQQQGISTATVLSEWAGQGNIRPLIDTGQLRAAITYVVRSP